ncbi:glycine-rich protein 1-like [Schistocerca nitens]|uniref:glycine-rich protein 1-like n=1 Tax=Schistocerca nitens TaxID=7011 RepID=UPI0021195409|nr:glycine-rich protein 1-like [Schistocerca nitens]
MRRAGRRQAGSRGRRSGGGHAACGQAAGCHPGGQAAGGQAADGLAAGGLPGGQAAVGRSGMRFGPRRVPAAPSDFAAAPRAASAAVAATTPPARPVDASRAASCGSSPGGRSGACGPSSVATAFGADGRRPLSRAAFPSGGCAACTAAAFLGHPQGV